MPHVFMGAPVESRKGRLLLDDTSELGIAADVQRSVLLAGKVSDGVWHFEI